MDKIKTRYSQKWATSRLFTGAEENARKSSGLEEMVELPPVVLNGDSYLEMELEGGKHAASTEMLYPMRYHNPNKHDFIPKHPALETSVPVFNQLSLKLYAENDSLPTEDFGVDKADNCNPQENLKDLAKEAQNWQLATRDSTYYDDISNGDNEGKSSSKHQAHKHVTSDSAHYAGGTEGVDNNNDKKEDYAEEEEEEYELVLGKSMQSDKPLVFKRLTLYKNARSLQPGDTYFEKLAVAPHSGMLPLQGPEERESDLLQPISNVEEFVVPTPDRSSMTRYIDFIDMDKEEGNLRNISDDESDKKEEVLELVEVEVKQELKPEPKLEPKPNLMLGPSKAVVLQPEPKPEPNPEESKPKPRPPQISPARNEMPLEQQQEQQRAVPPSPAKKSPAKPSSILVCESLDGTTPAPSAPPTPARHLERYAIATKIAAKLIKMAEDRDILEAEEQRKHKLIQDEIKKQRALKRQAQGCGGKITAGLHKNDYQHSIEDSKSVGINLSPESPTRSNRLVPVFVHKEESEVGAGLGSEIRLYNVPATFPENYNGGLIYREPERHLTWWRHMQEIQDIGRVLAASGWTPGQSDSGNSKKTKTRAQTAKGSDFSNKNNINQQYHHQQQRSLSVSPGGSASSLSSPYPHRSNSPSSAARPLSSHDQINDNKCGKRIKQTIVDHHASSAHYKHLSSQFIGSQAIHRSEMIKKYGEAGDVAKASSSVPVPLSPSSFCASAGVAATPTITTTTTTTSRSGGGSGASDARVENSTNYGNKGNNSKSENMIVMSENEWNSYQEAVAGRNKVVDTALFAAAAAAEAEAAAVNVISANKASGNESKHDCDEDDADINAAVASAARAVEASYNYSSSEEDVQINRSISIISASNDFIEERFQRQKKASFGAIINEFKANDTEDSFNSRLHATTDESAVNKPLHQHRLRPPPVHKSHSQDPHAAHQELSIEDQHILQQAMLDQRMSAAKAAAFVADIHMKAIHDHEEAERGEEIAESSRAASPQRPLQETAPMDKVKLRAMPVRMTITAGATANAYRPWSAPTSPAGTAGDIVSSLSVASNRSKYGAATTSSTAQLDTIPDDASAVFPEDSNSFIMWDEVQIKQSTAHIGGNHDGHSHGHDHLHDHGGQGNTAGKKARHHNHNYNHINNQKRTGGGGSVTSGTSDSKRRVRPSTATGGGTGTGTGTGGSSGGLVDRLRSAPSSRHARPASARPSSAMANNVCGSGGDSRSNPPSQQQQQQQTMDATRDKDNNHFNNHYQEQQKQSSLHGADGEISLAETSQITLQSNILGNSVILLESGNTSLDPPNNNSRSYNSRNFNNNNNNGTQKSGTDQSMKRHQRLQSAPTSRSAVAGTTTTTTTTASIKSKKRASSAKPKGKVRPSTGTGAYTTNEAAASSLSTSPAAAAAALRGATTGRSGGGGSDCGSGNNLGPIELFPAMSIYSSDLHSDGGDSDPLKAMYDMNNPDFVPMSDRPFSAARLTGSEDRIRESAPEPYNVHASFKKTKMAYAASILPLHVNNNMSRTAVSAAAAAAGGGGGGGENGVAGSGFSSRAGTGGATSYNRLPSPGLRRSKQKQRERLLIMSGGKAIASRLSPSMGSSGGIGGVAAAAINDASASFYATKSANERMMSSQSEKRLLLPPSTNKNSTAVAATIPISRPEQATPTTSSSNNSSYNKSIQGTEVDSKPNMYATL